MIQALTYRGIIYLKFGKKTSPGVMYSKRDLETGERPAVELWRDGTVTFEDRPEGDVSMIKVRTFPLWAYGKKIRRFRSRR